MNIQSKKCKIAGEKEYVLFSGCSNAVIVRNNSEKMTFFDIKDKANKTGSEIISNPFMDRALVQDLKRGLIRSEYSRYFPFLYYLATGTFFAITPPGEKVEDCFVKYIPFLKGDLKIKLPNRAKGRENIGIFMGLNDFSIVPDPHSQGNFVMYVKNLSNVVWHPVPEKEYVKCSVDIRTGVPNPYVLATYRGPERKILREMSDKPSFGLIIRDTGDSGFDTVFLEDNISQSIDELKGYKTVWIQK